ncbi:MAG: response regulator, partial [Alphaproteobacteria bacterium]
MTDVLTAQNQVRILCVDDEWIVRAGLNHLLAQQPGYQISGVDSVEDALTALDSDEAFDLIILDLKMPGSQPFAGVTKLHQKAPSVPIIVFSVYDSREDVLTAIQNGAMGYLTKATSGDDIKEAVSRVLGGEVWLPRSLLAMDNAQRVAEPRRGYSQE